MDNSNLSNRVNIRPGVSVLSIFRHLNYKAWYALAEFVDNSLQSFLTNQETLRAINGTNTQLIIDIELDNSNGGRLIIRDNAAGINSSDYTRAFRTAAVPTDRSGLSEFGVGMKSAACWFGQHWSVRTTAIGEEVERTMVFDVASIVRNSVEFLSPGVKSAKINSHYTEIIIEQLNTPIKGRTVTKIREHLASIYRIFIRENILVLRFNREVLKYQLPNISNTPYHKDETETSQLWRKDINLNFGEGLHIYGFAALREVASTSEAGFALFRRNRLIQGSGDEGYRPEFIFKKSNSYTYQRLFGELHVEGFEVTHTKDGFQWVDYEEIFLEFLKEELDRQPLPLLDQAEHRRVRLKPKDWEEGAKAALASTADAIGKDAPPVIQGQLESSPTEGLPPVSLPVVAMATERIIDVPLNDIIWRIIIELSTDQAVSEWLSISDNAIVQADGSKSNMRELHIRLSLAHPFTERFAGPTSEQIEPLLRIAAALALAEITARQAGLENAGSIRRRINDLLRNALAQS